MNPLPFHVPEQYRVGDRVVLAADIAVAEAWYGTYQDDSARALGKVMKVVGIHPLHGYQCGVPKGLTYWYPSCALARANFQSVVIDVPSI